MSKTNQKKTSPNTIAVNRQARHDYTIEERLEAGVALQGWEVKSLRAGKGQLTDSYIVIRKGEIWLLGSHIAPLISASTHVHAENSRTRKLLLHRKEIDRLSGLVQRSGYTLIPLSIYWHNNKIKYEIGLAKGKQQHDKRNADKEKDWQREKARMFKHKI